MKKSQPKPLPSPKESLTIEKSMVDLSSPQNELGTDFLVGNIVGYRPGAKTLLRRLNNGI